MRRIDAEATELAYGRVRERIGLRQDGHEGRGQAESGQRRRNVGFAAAEGGEQRGTLQKTLESRRRQSQHDLAKCHGRGRHALRPSRFPNRGEQLASSR
jgi:hypothetical protein